MKSKNVGESLRHAFEGLRLAAARERNFKIHIIMGILAVLCCIIFQVELLYFLLVTVAIFSVMTAELFNTAIEALTDLYCGNHIHPLAKLAKDVSAAAVLLTALMSLVIAAAVALSVLRRYVG